MAIVYIVPIRTLGHLFRNRFLRKRTNFSEPLVRFSILLRGSAYVRAIGSAAWSVVDLWHLSFVVSGSQRSLAVKRGRMAAFQGKKHDLLSYPSLRDKGELWAGVWVRWSATHTADAAPSFSGNRSSVTSNRSEVALPGTRSWDFILVKIGSAVHQSSLILRRLPKMSVFPLAISFFQCFENFWRSQWSLTQWLTFCGRRTRLNCLSPER